MQTQGHKTVFKITSTGKRNSIFCLMLSTRSSMWLMPLLNSEDYQPPWYLKNGHTHTVYPVMFKRKLHLPLTRERIYTEDDDFLDIDWYRSKQGNKKLAILSHGLEGHSRRPYMQGLAKALGEQGYDVILWNFRGCSGPLNKTHKAYHAGATYDLHTVVSHGLEKQNYREFLVAGFSLGGNMTLKYLADYPDKRLKQGIALSVPVDLIDSSYQIEKTENIIYQKRFTSELVDKLKMKQKTHRQLNSIDAAKIQSIRQFDDVYTAPVHGFKNALDYYYKNSSTYFLEKVKIPVLIINALDDPLLGNGCYPYYLANQKSNIYLMTPQYGGHNAFIDKHPSELYWSERKVQQWLANLSTHH